MGHCISAAILKSNFNPSIAKKYDLLGIDLGFELTMFPIDHNYTAYWGKKLDVEGKLPKTNSKNILFPDDLVVARLMKKICDRQQPLYAIIQTDYFGGIGEQWAEVYQSDRLVEDNISNINAALAFLGVRRKSDLDEFDTVNLSNYRSMPEYLEKYIDLAEQLKV